MKQGPRRLVCQTSLSSGLREGLAWKPGTKNVVGRHLVLRYTNVTVDSGAVRKVADVKLLQLRIDLAREDTLVSETLKRNTKPTKSGKKVNESQEDTHLWETML